MNPHYGEKNDTDCESAKIGDEKDYEIDLNTVMENIMSARYENVKTIDNMKIIRLLTYTGVYN